MLKTVKQTYVVFVFEGTINFTIFGGDALRGNTRFHPEHVG